MSTHTKRPDTEGEALSRKALADALRQVEQSRAALRPPAGRKPHYEGAGDNQTEDLTCPWCGSTNLQYDEMVRESRDIFPLGECGRSPNTLALSTDNVNHDAEDTDACIYCRDCHQESSIPEGMDIAWV